jgi:hypothetical protein
MLYHQKNIPPFSITTLDAPTKILTKSSSHNSHWFWWSWQNALLNQAPGPWPIGIYSILPLLHSNIIPPSFLSQNRPFPPLAFPEHSLPSLAFPEFTKNGQSKQISIFHRKIRCQSKKPASRSIALAADHGVMANP